MVHVSYRWPAWCMFGICGQVWCLFYIGGPAGCMFCICRSVWCMFCKGGPAWCMFIYVDQCGA